MGPDNPRPGDQGDRAGFANEPSAQDLTRHTQQPAANETLKGRQVPCNLGRGYVARWRRKGKKRLVTGPPLPSLAEPYAKLLNECKPVCEGHRDREHKKTRELSREFLNAREAI
jgi:hypothetical protein